MKPEELPPKPIAFHQLCALLRSILQAEPSIADAEWKARTLDALGRMGFRPPKSDQLRQAMSTIEQAMRFTIGPRPTQDTPPPKASPPFELPKEARTSTPLGWDVVARLMATLQRSASNAPTAAAPTAPSETLPIDEVAALNQFWSAAWLEGANRLELIRAFAEIAIIRPADWDYAAVRAHAHDDERLNAAVRDGCFVCRGPGAHWHHVIQIQFGGSNYVRNFVALCARCHSAVHPWLPVAPNTRGWTQLADCAPPAEQLKAIQRRRA